MSTNIGFRSALSERLLAHRPELERSILARVYAISDPTEGGDADYMMSLKASVSAAVGYGLTVVAGREDDAPLPPELIAQARYAARNSVSLDTILRRYFAGYALLSDFLLREVDVAGPAARAELQHALGSAAVLLDRLLVAVSEEHVQETERRFRSPEARLADRIRRFLAGEPVDTSDFGYDFDAWHLGVVGSGPGVSGAIRGIAGALGRNSFLVRPDKETIWAWLGGHCRLAADEALAVVERWQAKKVHLAFGEPGAGPEGWRLSHRQASAALPFARRGIGPVLYADVALLASALSDDVLVGSLEQIYLAPLAEDASSGAVARDTLRAYFASGRNVSSAASALGVSRQTVGSRLRVMEDRLGRTLDSCAAEIEVALQLESIGASKLSQF